MRKGFTLPEILVAVMIVAILAAMAVPQYEKAVEKSRRADVVSTLKKLHESKMRMLDVIEKTTYSSLDFGMENLDFTLNCKKKSFSGHQTSCETKDFNYSIVVGDGESSATIKNAVCAVRSGRVEASGTRFVYYGDAVESGRLVCASASNEKDTCEFYGMDNTTGAPTCGPDPVS